MRRVGLGQWAYMFCGYWTLASRPGQATAGRGQTCRTAQRPESAHVYYQSARRTLFAAATAHADHYSSFSGQLSQLPQLISTYYF